MNTGQTQTKVVINVSNQKYWKGQDRLKRTLQGNTDADILMFRSEAEVGAKPHKESMYGFKPKAFEKAYNMGYRKILWLDASMYVIKDLSPIFDKIDEYGYYFESSGWETKQWTNENTRLKYGDDGDMISSGVLGLNLNEPIALKFLEEWTKASVNGYFNGSHDNHRHDQTLASLIINKLKMKITNGTTYWQYGKPSEPTLHENILVLANGII